MSRRLLCKACARGRQAGQRVAMAATAFEPAEYERLVYGRAIAPSAAQRTMYVNGEPVHLPTDAFECDACCAAIRPGDPAMAETIWLDGRPEPPAWESDYVVAAVSGAARSAEGATPTP